VIILTHNS